MMERADTHNVTANPAEGVMAVTEPIEPVRLSLRVPLAPADAFALFTDKMATWWPAKTHSIFEDDVVDVVFEGKVGGRIYEVTTSGDQYGWGEVVLYERGKRFVMTWHPNLHDPTPTEVDVTFEADGDGTRVSLEHRGWERLGERAVRARAEYAGGWVTVLAGYENAA